MRRLLLLAALAGCRNESVPMPLPMPDEAASSSSGSGSSGADAGCRTDWVCCGPQGQQCPVDDGDGSPLHCLLGERTAPPGGCR